MIINDSFHYLKNFRSKYENSFDSGNEEFKKFREMRGNNRKVYICSIETSFSGEWDSLLIEYSRKIIIEGVTWKPKIDYEHLNFLHAFFQFQTSETSRNYGEVIYLSIY